MAITAGRLEIETPDHVVLRYQLAGAGNRGFAAILDFLVASIGIFAVGWSYQQPASGNPILLSVEGWGALLELLIAWLYFIVLESLGNGQTPGKRVFGLRAITAAGA